MAAITPMIPKAISNSVSVNPLLKSSLNFLQEVIFKALSGCPPPEVHAISTFHSFSSPLIFTNHLSLNHLKIFHFQKALIKYFLQTGQLYYVH